MKVLIFSDSHRSLAGMYAAIEAHRPDQVIHLGDLMEDAQEVAGADPKLPLCMVPGNCDGWTTEPSKKLIVLEGKRILLSHGHLWRVKQGMDTALAAARTAQADILLFGHTHQALYRTLEDGLLLLNPGASRSTYGLLELKPNWMDCCILAQD